MSNDNKRGLSMAMIPVIALANLMSVTYLSTAGALGLSGDVPFLIYTITLSLLVTGCTGFIDERYRRGK